MITTKEGQAALRRELERFGDRLLPGSAAAIAASPQWAELAANRDPARLARAVHDTFFETPYWDRHKSPDWTPPAGPPNPLRDAILRYEDLLKPGAAAKCYANWAVGLAGREGGELVEEVRRRLNDPANNAYLREPLPPRPDPRRDYSKRDDIDAGWLPPSVRDAGEVVEVDEETGERVTLRSFKL